MNAVFCVLFLFSVSWLSAAKEIPSIQCADTLFVPSSIIFLPYPPQPKADLSIFVRGILSSNVTGGVLAATFYSLDEDTKPWSSEYVDICSAFGCPLEAGFRDFEIRGVLRADLPEGRYIAKFVGEDDYSRPLACTIFVIGVDAHASKSVKRAPRKMHKSNAFFPET